MKNLKILAEPTPIEIQLDRTTLIVIDMQKDFLYQGGYGESLGNDVTILQRTIKPIQKLLQVAREKGLFIIHTREGHLPDLSDCPQTKLLRWPEGKRIGDVGPMGRILIRGEEGHSIINEVAPLSNEVVIDKPGKMLFIKLNLI